MELRHYSTYIIFIVEIIILRTTYFLTKILYDGHFAKIVNNLNRMLNLSWFITLWSKI